MNNIDSVTVKITGYNYQPLFDLGKLTAAERKAFDDLPRTPALPSNAELGTALHPANPIHPL